MIKKRVAIVAIKVSTFSIEIAFTYSPSASVFLFFSLHVTKSFSSIVRTWGEIPIKTHLGHEIVCLNSPAEFDGLNFGTFFGDEEEEEQDKENGTKRWIRNGFSFSTFPHFVVSAAVKEKIFQRCKITSLLSQPTKSFKKGKILGALFFLLYTSFAWTNLPEKPTYWPVSDYLPWG